MIIRLRTIWKIGTIMNHDIIKELIETTLKHLLSIFITRQSGHRFHGFVINVITAVNDAIVVSMKESLVQLTPFPERGLEMKCILPLQLRPLHIHFCHLVGQGGHGLMKRGVLTFKQNTFFPVLLIFSTKQQIPCEGR